MGTFQGMFSCFSLISTRANSISTCHHPGLTLLSAHTLRGKVTEHRALFIGILPTSVHSLDSGTSIPL